MHSSFNTQNGYQLTITADGSDKETFRQLLRGGDSLTIQFDPEGKLNYKTFIYPGDYLTLPERNPEGIRSPRTFQYLWDFLSQVPNTTMLKDTWSINGQYRKMTPEEADYPLSLVKNAFINQLQQTFRKSCKTTDIYVSALLNALKHGQKESLEHR